jgi:hypothetical protein
MIAIKVLHLYIYIFIFIFIYIYNIYAYYNQMTTKFNQDACSVHARCKPSVLFLFFFFFI